MQTIDCISKSDGYHGKPSDFLFMFMLMGLNIVPVLNASSFLCHIVFSVLINIFTAMHRSAFLGHFPQLQSNFDTGTSRDGAESSRLVLFDELVNITLSN